MVLPIRHTRLASSTCLAEKALPRATFQPSMERYCSLPPMMERGLQFWLPTITWPLARTTGEAAFTNSGQSCTRAAASVAKSEALPPMPVFTPAVLTEAPLIVTTLVPMEENLSATCFLEPSPISMIATTAAIPITMPSTVSAARIGLRTRAFRQVTSKVLNFISGGWL